MAGRRFFATQLFEVALTGVKDGSYVSVREAMDKPAAVVG
jgi:hypothetical protein